MPTPKHDFDFENFLPYQLAVTANAVSVSFGKIYTQSHGISRAEWRILFHLAKLDEGELISVRDLERRAHLEKSKASRAVSRLVDRGMVYKRTQEEDQRLVDIGLTEYGHQVVIELEPVATEFNAMLTSDLSPEERSVFLKAMRKVMDRTREREPEL